jgi:hypothetical protein
VPPGHLAELVPPLVLGGGGSHVPKMSWGGCMLWDCYNSPHGLEPLTVVREMGC